MSVMLYPCIFCVALNWICLSCVLHVCEFIFLGVVFILLLNVMEVLSVGGGTLLDR